MAVRLLDSLFKNIDLMNYLCLGPAAFEAAVPYAVIQQALMAQYNLNVINNLQHGPPINQVNAEEGPNAPPPPVIRHRWNRTKKACFLSALIGVALILLSLISHAGKLNYF